MSGYIGTAPVPQATQTRDSFTATSGQTSFATGGYTPNFLDVYLNGVKLASADYTATNGSDVVLASGAATGDILEVVAYTAFDTANVTGATNFTVTGAFTSQGIDDNANATAMTIASDESITIGGTVYEGSSTSGASSAHINSGGFISANVTNDYGMQVNRTGTDGKLFNFRKNGSDVGTIGVWNSDNISLYGNSTHAGIGCATNSVEPIRNNAPVDNSIDLGVSSARFKDLYLSGGVYLGGTGSANKVDDYEEGSFNLTMTGGSSNPSTTQLLGSTYVKIGKLVSFRSFGTLNNTGASGAIAFSGLPFTPTGVTIANIECNSQGTFSLSPYGYVSGTVIYIQQMRSNNTYAVVNHNVASSGEWSITGHFFTNS